MALQNWLDSASIAGKIGGLVSGNYQIYLYLKKAAGT